VRDLVEFVQELVEESLKGMGRLVSGLDDCREVLIEDQDLIVLK
jgi:hypothetical protein